MNRLATRIVALLALLGFSPALAMERASTPPKFPIPWGNSAGSSYIRSIPTTSQIGIQNCAASLTDGFPPLTFVPASAGGCPPFGKDFNGILKQVSQGLQWFQAGGVIFYDSAFSAAIGGYPASARVSSTILLGRQWVSTVDNNTTDPDAGGANWVQDPNQVPTGTPVASLSSTVPFGYVAANGLTIGNQSSNATGYAASDTQFLFAYVWANCPNTQCPIFTSGGGGSTRGATAAADYAANKAIAVWSMKATGLIGVDTMGGSVSTLLAGVPVTSGSTTVPGSILGENLHALTSGENGAHTHGNSLTDPGHAHLLSLTDPGHTHNNGLTDPGHSHTNPITDPGHSHSVNLNDPGHIHANSITQAQFALGTSSGVILYGTSLGAGAPSGLVTAHTTGITSSGTGTSTTGITPVNTSQVTGISGAADNHVSNVTITNAASGSGTAHNTVMRAITVYWNLKL